MKLRLQPQRAFPQEVLDLERRGIALPNWYAGPLYTGNGYGTALESLKRARTAVGPAAESPSSDQSR